MKDHIGEKLAAAAEFEQAKAIVDDYIDYYNNKRYQWHLAKLSPNEYYEFCTTGIYPLKAIAAPPVPTIEKKPEELGAAVEIANRVRSGNGVKGQYTGRIQCGRAALDGVTRITLFLQERACPFPASRRGLVWAEPR